MDDSRRENRWLLTQPGMLHRLAALRFQAQTPQSDCGSPCAALTPDRMAPSSVAG